MLGLFKKHTPIALPVVPMGLMPVPDWAVDDVLKLRQFLLTETGQSLMRRARAVEAQGCIKACTDPMHTTHSAARAAGFSDCLAWIESMGSEVMHSKISGAPAVHGANHTTASQQDEGDPVEIKRSF